MKRYLTAVASGVLGMTVAVGANALTITQTKSIASQATDWAQSLTFDTFDTSLGTLNSVTLTLSGTVAGDFGAENKNSDATTLNLTLSAHIGFQRPDTSLLLDVTPSKSETFNASAYDGVTDFGGVSGITFSGLSATQSVTIFDTIDLALFSTAGLGSITLPGFATATSQGSGGGNAIFFFDTDAAAELRIVYDYADPPSRQVPEPAELALFGVGLAGLGFMRRKRAG